MIAIIILFFLKIKLNINFTPQYFCKKLIFQNKPLETKLNIASVFLSQNRTEMLHGAHSLHSIVSWNRWFKNFNMFLECVSTFIVYDTVKLEICVLTLAHSYNARKLILSIIPIYVRDSEKKINRGKLPLQ